MVAMFALHRHVGSTYCHVGSFHHVESTVNVALFGLRRHVGLLGVGYRLPYVVYVAMLGPHRSVGSTLSCWVLVAMSDKANVST